MERQFPLEEMRKRCGHGTGRAGGEDFDDRLKTPRRPAVRPPTLFGSGCRNVQTFRRASIRS